MVHIFFEYLERSCYHCLACDNGSKYGKYQTRIQHPRRHGKVEWIGISLWMLADVRSLTNILVNH